MNLSLHIARRYLLAKKSHNAINIISLISIIGVALGTMALIIVLSVYNGFDQLIDNMYSGFNPEIKISSTNSRVFKEQDLPLEEIRQLVGVEDFSLTLETQALVRYKDRQSPCIIKGVDGHYIKVSKIDSTIYRGEWSMKRAHHPGVVMGYGLARTIGAGIRFIDPLTIYVPRREGRISVIDPSKSFLQQTAFPNAFFIIGQPEIDENYILMPLETVRGLLRYTNEVSSLEIKLKEDADLYYVQDELINVLEGTPFEVKNRREQEASLFRMMKTEKWMTYLILMFILLIAAFNIVGTMSMLMLDKRKDMQTLSNMGAPSKMIRKIFLFEGWLISLSGALIGLVVGWGLCLLQIKFEFIQMGQGFVVDGYPIVMQWADFIIIYFTVAILGFLVAYLPVRYIKFSV